MAIVLPKQIGTKYPLHSRIVLHEIDHLDGKIFLERMKKEEFSSLYWNENLDIRKKD